VQDIFPEGGAVKPKPTSIVNPLPNTLKNRILERIDNLLHNALNARLGRNHQNLIETRLNEIRNDVINTEEVDVVRLRDLDEEIDDYLSWLQEGNIHIGN
jgi:hypothetical protein